MWVEEDATVPTAHSNQERVGVPLEYRMLYIFRKFSLPEHCWRMVWGAAFLSLHAQKIIRAVTPSTVMAVGLSGHMMPLAVKGGFTAVHHGWEIDEDRQKYDVFGLSSIVCQLHKKLFGCRSIV